MFCAFNYLKLFKIFKLADSASCFFGLEDVIFVITALKKVFFNQRKIG